MEDNNVKANGERSNEHIKRYGLLFSFCLQGGVFE